MRRIGDNMSVFKDILLRQRFFGRIVIHFWN